ncbi:hypothetical protein WMY93_015304 [Mugilogobius chulae]|uniref:Uncharacterized protein n=1 Tax=Mugilogobius chulae TaxID=88201 RepID=A0AAW0NQV2_9GOBI
MRVTLLWLWASLGLASVALTRASPLRVMSAPNLLRVGTAENVFVECQDCAGEAPMTVEISARSFPKDNLLQSTRVELNRDNGYQALAQLQISSFYFDRDPEVKQYVYLRAAFPGHTLEKLVLVSFQAGFIFIQTDKTLYTPGSELRYRVFALTPDMGPFGRPSVRVEFVTPDGLVFSHGLVRLTDGMLERTYTLDEPVSTGKWKIRSWFEDNPQQTYSAEFEVGQYAQPSFEVKLTPESAFYFYDSETFKVQVKATYLFGKGVGGVAFVKFGIIKDGARQDLPSSLQRITISAGEGEAALQKTHVLQTFPNVEDLVGGSVFVTAVVHTDSGSERVESELRNIPIVQSPYIISFDRTARYFKPGMPFHVTVTVTDPNGSPAGGVPVTVMPGPNTGATTGADGRVSVSVNTRASDTSLSVTVRTSKVRLPHQRQATATLSVKPRESKTSSYIHISLTSTDVKVGRDLNVLLSLNNRGMFEITYLTVSRGQLVGFGRRLSENQTAVVLSVPVSRRMLPSFRLIVYYHHSPSELVSDSVWVDVSSVATLKLEPKRPSSSYQPLSEFSLKITGDPGATVALSAVDKSISALNKLWLTQKKARLMNILLLQRLCLCFTRLWSLQVWETVEKADSGCSPGGGRDDMAVFSDAGLLFDSDAAGETLHRRDVKCPAAARTKRDSSDVKTTPDAENHKYTNSSEISARTQFPDSWWWFTVQILSVERKLGICVGKPLDVVVFKEFIIDVRLPSSAVKGEQIEVRTIVHNYLQHPITVRVDVVENPEVCVSASDRGRYSQEVQLKPSSSRAVPFVIIPLREGDVRIEVTAAVMDSRISDGVGKTLRVVPKGVLTRVNKVIDLNPEGPTQELTITNNAMPDMVPNTRSRTKALLSGRESVSPLLDRLLEASSLRLLIYKPTGAGESNVYHLMKPVIATTYLDRTNQWRRWVWSCFHNQMRYAKGDGSFAMWPEQQSSVWLTAFVVKIFSMAKDLVRLDERAMCNAVQFLIHAQQEDGEFEETGKIYFRENTGDVLGVDSDASMTAFCVIAIQESRRTCEKTVSGLSAAVEKSVLYLERRLHALTNPYAVAITSYALANEYKLNKTLLYSFVSPERDHWASPRGQTFTLETTAYALLTLVKANLVFEARPVVRWFTKQQKTGGGYGSVQATLLVHQAVARYVTAAGLSDDHLQVSVKIPRHVSPYRFFFHKLNRPITWTTRAFGVNDSVTVRASGTGRLTLTKSRRGQGDVYRLTAEFFYKNKEENSSLSVLEVSLLAGFTAEAGDLNLTCAGPAPVVSQWELNSGFLRFHMDQVAHSPVQTVSVRLRQTENVKLLPPASVSLYELYHAEETKCVQFYQPQRRRSVRLC